MTEGTAIAFMGKRAYQQLIDDSKYSDASLKYTGCMDVCTAYETMLNWRETGKSFAGLSRYMWGPEAHFTSSEGNKVKKAMKRIDTDLVRVERRFKRKMGSMADAGGK